MHALAQSHTSSQVSIASGTFKYVLMRVYDPAAPDSNTSAAAGLPAGAAAPAPRSKLLVWGHPAADYHNHIYQRAKAAAAREGLKCDVLGGGRIEHYPEQKVGRRCCVPAGRPAARHDQTPQLTLTHA